MIYTIPHMTAVSVSNLKKYFQVYKRSAGLKSSLTSIFKRKADTVKAVNGISFKIAQGELIGFIGPNGAGKTTTLKCLSGLLYPSLGVINVLGYKPFDRKTDFLKKISLVMGQKNQLWWDLPSIDTFRLNKAIYDIEDREFDKTLNELTDLLSVEKLLTTPVRQLSLGQRMKMELIASLLHRPKVLFLDEPTIGLDVVMQKRMREFISVYNQKFKATILLTSHYMADVKELCSRVIIIDRGKLLYDGLLEKLVEKYADNKIITVSFDKEISLKDLTKYGRARQGKSNKIILTVSKKEVTEVAAAILKNYHIKDFNIEDPEIEDVIREVFDKKDR